MEARALAWITEKGGAIIEGPCTVEGVRYIWIQCAAGHKWRARPYNLVHHHSWCPECYGNKPLTIEAMCDIAGSRGGKCLSETYHGLTQKLTWECSFGHQWDAIPNNVKNHGSWCPHCKVNVGEELVRAALEEAFSGKSFDRTRREPWMEGLELDGYNEELRLAFEYQGKQHYERVGHFQPNEKDFEDQLERDAQTSEQCQDEFVSLLIIPYTVRFTKIRAHVRRELVKLGYEIGPEVGTVGEFYDRVRAQGPSTERQYKKIVEVIKRKGGECLSPQYLGYRVPLRIRCGKDHEFLATPEAIDQPASRGTRFCPECGGTRRKEDHELREAVEKCGYEFLGVESRTSSGRSRRYIRVQCPVGHEYETLWDNFCPKDDTPRKGCATCHFSALGASKRGSISQWTDKHKILPTEGYKSAAVICEWACSQGHKFVAKFTVLKGKKSPCTECGLGEFAAENNLEQMTPWTKYCGPTTPLTWKCRGCDDTFVASLAAIGRKKTMCPNCT
jgi:hypothetical protein